MKYEIHIRTSDGVLHATERRAKAHAEERYGEALCALAHRVAADWKYAQILKALEASHDLMREILAAHEDKELPPLEAEIDD